ncbi:hypothetical protein BO71DRAFT_170618 [Aspergillus ellipticus CBS 707.79]|uniref:Uncharacterized protein n=1 Tax=Aspergillus ellipticus CBS 707.79 TaxID=1448320 RepID=A0A319DPN7_9EURO|nr:hypothetical protein BO71DRAFT_170618 [Aspergillus ellipticus CBS 707.79]
MGKFKWNRETLVSYLGGDEEDLKTLRTRLTDLLLQHDKLYHSCRNKGAKSQQEEFIYSILGQLPDYVQDASHNTRRMQGIMGLVCVIKRDYKAREPRPPTTQMSQWRESSSSSSSGSSGSEESEDSDEEEEEEANNIINNNRAPRIKTEPIESSRKSSVVIVNTRTLPNDIEIDPTSTRPVEPKHEPSARSARAGEEIKPPAERVAKQPRSHAFSHDLLARNIWVINEPDPSRHGLCTVQELALGLSSVDSAPQLTELNFTDWLLNVKNQCGYDSTIHRLEYRPSATEFPLSSGRPMTAYRVVESVARCFECAATC